MIRRNEDACARKTTPDDDPRLEPQEPVVTSYGQDELRLMSNGRLERRSRAMAAQWVGRVRRGTGR